MTKRLGPQSARTRHSPRVDGNPLDRLRRRWLYEAAGAGGLRKRVAVERFVVLIDVVAEFDRAVARHPAGEIDPGDRHFVRQIDDLGLAGGDAGVDGGAVPAWHVLEDPGGEVADIVDAGAAVGIEAVIVGEQLSRVG